MSWKRLKKRHRGREKGAKFKAKTLFFTPTYKYLADIVDFRGVKEAKISAKQLESQFNHAQMRDKKRRVKQATVAAANRCDAAAKSPKLSQARKQELKEMGDVYRQTYQKMVLPPKNVPKVTMKEIKPIGVSTTGRYELREKGKSTLYFDRKDDALIARGKLPLGRFEKSWVEDGLTGACVGGTKGGSAIWRYRTRGGVKEIVYPLGKRSIEDIFKADEVLGKIPAPPPSNWTKEKKEKRWREIEAMAERHREFQRKQLGIPEGWIQYGVDQREMIYRKERKKRPRSKLVQNYAGSRFAFWAELPF